MLCYGLVLMIVLERSARVSLPDLNSHPLKVSVIVVTVVESVLIFMEMIVSMEWHFDCLM